MNFRISGKGGLYPNGCVFQTQTANAAIERYHAVKVACGAAAVRDRTDKGVSLYQLAAMAEEELYSEV